MSRMKTSQIENIFHSPSKRLSGETPATLKLNVIKQKRVLHSVPSFGKFRKRLSGHYMLHAVGKALSSWDPRIPVSKQAPNHLSPKDLGFTIKPSDEFFNQSKKLKLSKSWYFNKSNYDKCRFWHKIPHYREMYLRKKSPRMDPRDAHTAYAWLNGLLWFNLRDLKVSNQLLKYITKISGDVWTFSLCPSRSVLRELISQFANRPVRYCNIFGSYFRACKGDGLMYYLLKEGISRIRLSKPSSIKQLGARTERLLWRFNTCFPGIDAVTANNIKNYLSLRILIQIP
jgi:hypothetical protein